jgi:hypothetical protein
MRKFRYTLAAALAAASLLGLAAGPATANRSLGISEELPENVGRIIFTYNDMMRSNRISCELFMTLDYAEVISKETAGELTEPIGAIVRARTNNCREGLNNWEVTFLRPVEGIPMRYESFLGNLPNIAGVLITALEVGVHIRRNTTNCLFRGNVPFLANQEGGGTRFNQKRTLSNRLLRVEGMECPAMSGLELTIALPISPAIDVRLL